MSRARFEDVHKHFPLGRNPSRPDDYQDAGTQARWEAWQDALDSLDVEAAAQRLHDDALYHGDATESVACVRAVLAAAKGGS